ncbi:hypothetical protein ACS0TY_011055 [Phlomoides rotata]
MTSSGIRPADSYEYLAHSAGGEEEVGHTMKDHMNFVNREKMKNIEDFPRNKAHTLLMAPLTECRIERRLRIVGNE